MHKFQELKVWQKAMDMSVSIYRCTENLPNTEKFGLISQIRRSTISICSNIAEGAGRNTKGEFIQFLGIANGSAYELQTQIELAYRLTFLTKEIKDGLVAEIEEIEKMLYNLMKSLK
ncbi:four helix bundle protein [Sphingobacterium prati]|uniref:four helix bundle protein n=1 Tax=Sphingobacterium prati TaxID=2737006 RepID=UPI001555B799|nr:four helix bundle protein [Sphingobacterium prati]NPE48957.1 four helix bundle protein [Sphingobacterium prati]